MELFDAVTDPRDAILINDLVSSTAFEESTESLSDGSCGDDDFYFILSDDTEYLTDYLVLLFGQVKRGILNDTDKSKANRSCKFHLGFKGMRCRHCGGHEKVSQSRKRSRFLLFQFNSPWLFPTSGKLLPIIKQESTSGNSYASHPFDQV